MSTFLYVPPGSFSMTHTYVCIPSPENLSYLQKYRYCSCRVAIFRQCAVLCWRGRESIKSLLLGRQTVVVDIVGPLGVTCDACTYINQWRCIRQLDVEQAIVEGDPVFAVSNNIFMSRPEKYRHGLRKSSAFKGLVDRLKLR